MESSDVHKAADRRHTRQKKTTTKLIGASLPPSPVMTCNRQSQKSRRLCKLLGNHLRKAFFSDINIQRSENSSVLLGSGFQMRVVSRVRNICRVLAAISVENRPSYGGGGSVPVKHPLGLITEPWPHYQSGPLPLILNSTMLPRYCNKEKPLLCKYNFAVHRALPTRTRRLQDVKNTERHGRWSFNTTDDKTDVTTCGFYITKQVKILFPHV